jgi:NAD(P)-dependent dehydrogenase (short-subunit alcohol dehydrogenase family)
MSYCVDGINLVVESRNILDLITPRSFQASPRQGHNFFLFLLLNNSISSMSFKDKVIVITGGASGMCHASAKLLASKGAKVSICDIQEAPLKAAASQIEKAGGTVFAAVVDVRNRQQGEAWINTTVEKFGKLDGAANIAGVIPKSIGKANIEDQDDEEWKFVMDVNVTGVLNCLRAQVPHFNDGGSIVNAGSVAGLLGEPGNTSYVASKHAVIGITKSVAKELGSRQI